MLDKIDRLKLKLTFFKKDRNPESENKTIKNNTLSQLNIDLDLKTKEIEDHRENLKLKNAFIGDEKDKQFLKNKIDYN